MAAFKHPIVGLLFSMALICAVVQADPIEKQSSSSRSTRPSKALRISEQKCKGYKELYKIVYTSHTQKKLGVIKCPKIYQPSIVGGKNANLYEFPHMASLLYKSSGKSLVHKCGGTLISDNFILTAAHCIPDNDRPVRVMLGDVALAVPTGLQKGRNLFRKSSDRKQMPIKKFYIHPKYTETISAYHDIALIELAHKVIFIRRYDDPIPIRPACLPQLNQFKRLSNVSATGWGKLGHKQEAPHNILQTVELPIQDQNTCIANYQENQIDFKVQFPHQITSDQICAGDIDKDTCMGDSGGPITTFEESMPCMHYVVGVTSAGNKFCGNGVPAVYTRVDQYLDWIENIVWKSSKSK